MAACALNFVVRTVDRKAGRLLMIEGPHSPAPGDVTRFALLAKRVLVHIVLSVAATASAGCFAISSRFVTVLTFGGSVSAGERKSGFVVIETGLFPARIDMARGTILAKFAFVHIFLHMTRDACCFQFLCVERSGVALTAG
jgi:hypothetical protein